MVLTQIIFFQVIQFICSSYEQCLNKLNLFVKYVVLIDKTNNLIKCIPHRSSFSDPFYIPKIFQEFCKN